MPVFLTSYPPLRRQFTEGHDSFLLVVHHNLDAFILIRHKLNHQFPAGSARCAAGTVWQDGNNLLYLLFAVSDHIENGIPFCANTQRGACVDTNAGVYLSTAGKDSRGYLHYHPPQ